METVIATIAAALISAIGAFAGSVLTINKKYAVLETKLDDLKEDVNKLSDRVDEHNHFSERMARLETMVENRRRA